MKLPAELVSRLSGLYKGRGVCVTGGTGFIGSHVVDALMTLGASPISVVDDLSNSGAEHIADLIELEPKRVRFVHGSILDDDALDQAMLGCDLVLHLAAVGSVPLSLAEPQRTFSVNSTGTVRVLQAARRAGVKRVVSASSSSVYGDSGLSAAPATGAAAIGASASPPMRVETMLPVPLSPYGASKLAGEAAVKAWAASYGLSAVSLRFFNVFGPRQRADSPYAAVIPAWSRALVAGKPPVIFGDGEQTRDFTPVASAVAAMLLAGSTSKELHGEAVNIGSGKRTRLLDLCKMMAEAFGTPQLQPVFQVPRTGDPRHSMADVSLARQMFDYVPVMSLNDALPEIAAYYRQSLAANGRR